MDNIDVEYAIEKGLYVINTPTASCKSVAELVFAHFFSLARNLHESNRLMPLEGDTKFDSLKKSFAKAYELSGKTLGIIGLGKIGIEVAKLGISLGMNIVAYNRTPKTEVVELNFFDGQSLKFEIKSVTLDEVLQKADFITVNTSKLKSYIIDAPQFEMMKDGAYLVNFAKGAVNEVSLVEYLENKKIAGAALDVFELEPKPDIQVLMNPSLSLSPNVASVTTEAQEKTGKELAEQIIKISREYYAHI